MILRLRFSQPDELAGVNPLEWAKLGSGVSEAEKPLQAFNQLNSSKRRA
jgi:hypothetical protein